MPYTDFHYTPTGTGVISGKEVLEQTEDAINDLGGQISGDVQTAIDTANNALNTANSASADAQNAVNTANTAHTAATNAQNTANAAQTTATNAQTAAQNAQNDVNALGNRVTTAENNITQNTTDISGLTTRMGTAEGNITTLQNDVVTAQGTATSAQNTATMARQQAYVLRYSSTAITDNSTIAYSTLDNTDNIKVSDKIIDTDGKIFSIVSVDSANETVTVGSALIDLALDANVVHLTGSETITGAKYFNGIIYSIGGIQTRLNTQVTSGESSSKSWAFIDNAYKSLFKLVVSTNTDKSTRIAHVIYNVDSNNTETLNRITWQFDNNSSVSELRPTNNAIKLGTSLYRWSEVYSTNYYYGSNNVEFSTKFVTTDTNQTITGNKTFSSNVNVYNSDSNATTPNLYLRSSKIEISSQGNTSGDQNLTYLDKNGTTYAYVKGAIQSNGAGVKIRAIAKDSSNNSVINELQMLAYTNGNKAVFPSYSNEIDLGTSSYKWKSFNGVEPSSLSLPSGNASDVIDISSYLVNLDGTNNTYVAPSNGWITINMNNCTGIHATITGFWGDSRIRSNAGAIKFLMPVLKNQTVTLTIHGGTINNARFIPCQGNV